MSTQTETKPATQSEVQARIAAAVNKYAKTFQGFAAAGIELDRAKEDYNAKAEGYAKAKADAVDGVIYAMDAAGFKEKGFPSQEHKNAFKTAWSKSLGREYQPSTIDRMWSELTTAATHKTGQRFTVSSDSAERMRKQREEAAKKTKDLMAKLGVNEHTAPIGLKQKAQELILSNPEAAKKLLDEAERREAQVKKAEDATRAASIKAKRDYIMSLVKTCGEPELDALIATAKKLKMAVKVES